VLGGGVGGGGGGGGGANVLIWCSERHFCMSVITGL